MRTACEVCNVSCSRGAQARGIALYPQALTGHAGGSAGRGWHLPGRRLDGVRLARGRLRSAVDVAQRLGASVPWTPRAVSPKISLVDRAFMAIFDRFARAAITVGSLRLILPNGEELHYGDMGSCQPPCAPG